MLNSSLFTSNSSEWETPQDLYDALDARHHFTLDVCALDYNHKTPVWLTPFDDALSLDWVWVCKVVIGAPAVMWMNPPYGRTIGQWVAKAAKTRRRGATIVCLLPARTDTKWWHAHIWDCRKKRPRPGVEVDFLPGRLHFGGAANGAPFPSAVVTFRPVRAETPRRRGGSRS